MVVGSGAGGMCAGARLAHAGYKTLVVEKLPLIGGRCSTIDYKGFKLSTGAISLPAYGGPFERTFEEVGAEYDVRPLPRDLLMHYRIRGEDFPVPEKDGLKAVIAYASKDQGEVEAITGAIERGVRWQEPSAMISLRDWLLQYTHNETILDIFQAIAVGHQGLNLHELPAVEFFRYLKRPIILQTRGFAPGGSIAVMESLAGVIRRNGGQVWTRCPAKRIIVADGRAKGVVVDRRGEELEIEAKAVVSNVGPNKTVDLAGSESFDKGYLRELKETLRPACFIIIYIATPKDRPLMEPVRMYLTGIRRMFGIRCLTKICPEFAPPDKHLLYASAVPGHSLPPINFQKEIELSLLDLKENLPGFDRYADIIWITCLHRDWPFMRAWPGYYIPQKTSVENLYNVGDGVLPVGMVGLEACAESARIAAEDIKNRIEPSTA